MKSQAVSSRECTEKEREGGKERERRNESEKKRDGGGKITGFLLLSRFPTLYGEQSTDYIL